MQTDGLKLTGQIIVRMFDKDGQMIQEQTKNNLVVTAGKNQLATGAGLSTFGYIAAGTDGTAPTLGNTALGVEAFRKLGSLSSSSNVWTNTVVYGPADGTGSIQEVGLFDAVSGGVMLARQTITTFTKTASNSMTVTWNITIS